MADQVFPCLLLPGRAEAAVEFYVGLLPGARRRRTLRGGPGGPDAVLSIEFELDGRLHLALNAGPEPVESFGQSLVVACADQAELDRVWDAFCEGGRPSACGWVTDRFGVMWQVTPAHIFELLSDPEHGPRVFAAMVRMVKLDIAALEAA